VQEHEYAAVWFLYLALTHIASLLSLNSSLKVLVVELDIRQQSKTPSGESTVTSYS
jgi:hypothetical protein